MNSRFMILVYKKPWWWKVVFSNAAKLPPKGYPAKLGREQGYGIVSLKTRPSIKIL